MSSLAGLAVLGMTETLAGALRVRGYLQAQARCDDADDVVRTLSSFCVPVFEKMLSDGTIVEGRNGGQGGN